MRLVPSSTTNVSALSDAFRLKVSQPFQHVLSSKWGSEKPPAPSACFRNCMAATLEWQQIQTSAVDSWVPSRPSWSIQERPKPWRENFPSKCYCMKRLAMKLFKIALPPLDSKMIIYQRCCYGSMLLSLTETFVSCPCGLTIPQPPQSLCLQFVVFWTLRKLRLPSDFCTARPVLSVVVYAELLVVSDVEPKNPKRGICFKTF